MRGWVVGHNTAEEHQVTLIVGLGNYQETEVLCSLFSFRVQDPLLFGVGPCRGELAAAALPCVLRLAQELAREACAL